MRGRARRLIGTVLVGVLVAPLAACGLPDGIDGDLASSWQPLSEPEVFTPEVGSCHESAPREREPLYRYDPVDCEGEHFAETIHVGEFTGSPADRVVPPSSETGTWRSAYRECEDEAADFLGDHFLAAYLTMYVSVPSPAAWDGGARWFRCDLVEYDVVDGSEVARSGTLADALVGESELRVGCLEVDYLGDLDEEYGSVTSTPVDCEATHQAEFVGLWDADGELPSFDPTSRTVSDAVHDACRSKVAEYVGVPDDHEMQFRTGTIADWMTEEEWANGQRTFRCYLWLDEDLTGSREGTGDDGLPVR